MKRPQDGHRVSHDPEHLHDHEHLSEKLLDALQRSHHASL
jgi:hypothetical protein